MLLLIPESSLRGALVAGVALALLVSACGSGVGEDAVTGASQTSVTAEPDESTTITAVDSTRIANDTPIALSYGFRRCSVLLSTGVVDGPLSDDPEIARAQQWRADNGLRSDEDWVRQVPTMDRTSPMANAFDAPLTDDEVTGLTTRGADIDHEALNAYTTEHQATLGGYWLDHASGAPTISFTENVEQHRAEVADRVPGVRVVAANLTEAELAELQTTLVAQLADLGLQVSSGVLIQAGGGVVSIGVPVLDEPTVELVAQVADSQLVCLEGQELDLYTAPGPQAENGDGWRLLALRPTDLPFGIVSDQASLDQIWTNFAPGEPLPQVDFTTELVVTVPTFGGGTINGPCGTRFDGWQLVDGVVRLDLPSPGGQTGCNAVAEPGAYMIAIDATDLPEGPVTIEIARKQMPGAPLRETFTR